MTPVDSGFPYTDEQVERAYEAAQQTTVGFDCGDIREILRGLHEVGITVDFPDPRFYVKRDTDRDAPRWYVRDREDGGLNVAWFYGHRSEHHARDHAALRNREVRL